MREQIVQSHRLRQDQIDPPQGGRELYTRPSELPWIKTGAYMTNSVPGIFGISWIRWYDQGYAGDLVQLMMGE